MKGESSLFDAVTLCSRNGIALRSRNGIAYWKGGKRFPVALLGTSEAMFYR
jgi:hypothetical protein